MTIVANELDTFLGAGGVFLAVVGIGLAALGLWYAVKTDRSVGKTLKGVTDATRALQEVEQGLSTRSLSEFPGFVDQIVDEVLTKATMSITVLCDLPAYAVFSNPHAWGRYSEVLSDRVRHAWRPDTPNVYVKCLTARRRREFLKDQFGEEDWPAIRADKLASFRGEHSFAGLPSDEGPDEREEFLARLNRVEDDEALKLGAIEIDAVLPVYFWVADDVAAVFALTRFTDKGREVGFYTRDTRMVEALKGIYDRYQPSDA